MKKAISLATFFTVAFLFLASQGVMAQKKGGPWTVPAKYKAMKSTVKAGDAASVALGKELFTKHCKSCHGSKGLGDGPKAATLKTEVPSFANAAFKAQADGEIYYQSIIGRDDMPNFEKKITDEGDRWAVISYIRSLK